MLKFNEDCYAEEDRALLQRFRATSLHWMSLPDNHSDHEFTNRSKVSELVLITVYARQVVVYVRQDGR
ncbi:hypothetical protein TNCV_4761521 [Trichonephila clavipes]|uniref:Uncharacterized protein n=1 Tax=Trichonephila clavipes TaxID=2585209 RepID=A0A8X6V3J2_TRICX|nr:hypothetical protein TNCV_4761521 [Trichonephila clavipes]